MSCHNKLFAFVSVLVIIFCTSCASDEEVSKASKTALQKDTYVCREIAHPKNNKASDLGWGESMVNSPGSFTILTGSFPSAGVSRCTKYEYLSGKWDKLQIPVTTGEDILTAFYKSESGKLYGRVVNRETKVYAADEEGNRRSNEEFEEAFIYIINEEDGTAERMPVKKWKGIEFIDNLEWEGVIKEIGRAHV